jgi:hypothetical protein
MARGVDSPSGGRLVLDYQRDHRVGGGPLLPIRLSLPPARYRAQLLD